MGSKLGGGDDELMADINITPFVDIILVVLIIFMVTATTIAETSIKVNLPDAASGEATDATSVGVTLLSDGALLVDGEASDGPRLQASLRAAKARGEDVVVLIAAERDVQHGRVVWVMDLVKSEGIGKFAINIQKADAVPPDPARSPLPSRDGG